jgi:hypothetical protein
MFLYYLWLKHLASRTSFSLAIWPSGDDTVLYARTIVCCSWGTSIKAHIKTFQQSLHHWSDFTIVLLQFYFGEHKFFINFLCIKFRNWFGFVTNMKVIYAVMVSKNGWVITLIIYFFIIYLKLWMFTDFNANLFIFLEIKKFVQEAIYLFIGLVLYPSVS